MKLTYGQIIKVLEHCISTSDNYIVDDCKGCLLDKECGKDCDTLLKTALDFIKYQHKVINSATQEIVDLKIKVKEQRAEIERYKGVIKLLEKDVKDANKKW